MYWCNQQYYHVSLHLLLSVNVSNVYMLRSK